MKNKELIQRVQSLYSKGVPSDDSSLSDRHIYSVLLTMRSTLLSQAAGKKQKISQWSYQTINCAELIEAPVHECLCLPSPGCSIMRTKYKIPTPITDMNTHLIQSVTSLDGTVVFSEVSWAEVKYKKASKYTSKKPDYYMKDGYLYFTIRSLIKAVVITGLFDNPLDVEAYPSVCKDCVDCTDCESYLEKEFPIDKDMSRTVIDMAKAELIEQFSQMQNDLTNNGVDTPSEVSK